MLTTPQMRAGTKSVTRRRGWAFLKVGDRLMACEKCQGLGKGGKIKKIRVIEVTSLRRQRLKAMLKRGMYRGGIVEAQKEGFPNLDNERFVEMFCRHMKCTPDDIVNRIGFKFIGECL